jgi:hypothetical protein
MLCTHVNELLASLSDFERQVFEALQLQLKARLADDSCGEDANVDDPIKSCGDLAALELAQSVAAAIDRAIPVQAVRYLEKHRARALKALRGTE